MGFARLSRRPPGPGFETSTYFRSPKPGTPPPDSPPGGARPEGGVWVWHWALRSAAPRRGRNSLVAESPWCGQGTHVAFGEAPRRPTATKTEWAPPGRANLHPFLVPPGLLPMLKTLPRQFHTPGPRDWRRGRWLSPGSKPRGADESAHVGANRNGKHSVARKSLRDTHPERRK